VHCRELAHFAQTKVISADYPLAPEHKFPAAPEACYEVTAWIARFMGEWKWDLDRLYIGGASAGATLSAVVAQMIRDRGGPKLRGQILICPSTDSNFDTPSYLENATGTNLTREKCMLFVSMYCPDSTQDHNPLACPLHAKSFANLPPAMVVTAECDPLRDDGRAYARKLQEAHIPCDDLCYEGMMHCFSTFPIDFPEKWDVINKIRDFVHK
jgi:acetyl esterase